MDRSIFLRRNIWEHGLSTCTLCQFDGISTDILWSFDCQTSAYDISSLFNRTPINYPSPDFSGKGLALQLKQTSQQYVNSARPFHLANSSFTITAWISPSTLNSASAYQVFDLCNTTCIPIGIVYNYSNNNYSVSLSGAFTHHQSMATYCLHV